MKEPVWGLDSCYQILGLTQDCSEKDVKRAYRKLSLRHHPDKSKDDLSQRKFILIRLAYEWVMHDLANRNPNEKYTKPRTYFSQVVPGFSEYHKIWDDALHSEEFKDFDKKHPGMYPGKGAGHIVDMGAAGYFDEQGFYHGHRHEKQFPAVKLQQILETYKPPRKKGSGQKRKKVLSLKKKKVVKIHG